MDNVRAVILAAGLGKRISGGSDLPKALREANGKPLLAYVLEALDFLPRENIIIVVGHKREMVIERFPGYTFAVQEEQLGTGHAAECAAPALQGFDGSVLIAYGDMPMMRRETYLTVLREHRDNDNDCTLLAGVFDEPLPFGRVIRGGGGGFLKIVEAKDASPEELAVRELNAGIYAFNSEKLFSALRETGFNNAQKEKYLTDAPGIIRSHGGRVGICARRLGDEILGVNTPEDLARVEALLAAY